MTEKVLSNMVVVQAKDGWERELEAALTRLTVSFRSQAGCLQYDSFQSFENPSRFMLVMQWQDEASLAGHFVSEPLREFFETIAAQWLECFSEEEYRAFSQGTNDFGTDSSKK